MVQYTHDIMDRVTNISCRAASGATLGGLASDGDVAGREWSAATGLINFRMRWYDAKTGRWLSKDPIGLSGGLNLYAFCGGDSVNYRDPDGNVLIFAPALMLPPVAVAAAAAIIVINTPQIVECYCAERICTQEISYVCNREIGKMLNFLYYWVVSDSNTSGCRGN